jgi:hypothetical protein
MKRPLRLSALLLFALAMSSSAAQAATITQCFGSGSACVHIADFSWDRDSVFADDTFTLANISTGALAGDFTDLRLYLDGSPDVFQTFFPDPLAAGESADTFNSSVLSARVEFLFHGVLFSADLSSASLVDDGFNAITSTALFAEAVPEPSTLSLMGAAAALLASTRRRKSARR